MVVLDAGRRAEIANLAARRLFRIEETAPWKRFPTPEVEQFLERHEPRRQHSEEITLELDDSSRTFRFSVVPLPDTDEEMLIAEDVTEILRSNRLEAWAEMARQVAHEIKNPLTPIQLAAEHLRTMAERDDPNLQQAVSSAVGNILRQVDTLRETSRDFSDYASLRSPVKQPVDLRQMLEELAASYRNSSEQRVTLHLEIDPSTPRSIAADPRMIRGAIANLIENAFQATETGGRVDLESRGSEGVAIISVTDTGPGVGPDIVHKIFDPYFSTKSTGTGLGLAIAREVDRGSRRTDPGGESRVGIPYRGRAAGSGRGTAALLLLTGTSGLHPKLCDRECSGATGLCEKTGIEWSFAQFEGGCLQKETGCDGSVAEQRTGTAEPLRGEALCVARGSGSPSLPRSCSLRLAPLPRNPLQIAISF